jgi:cellulose synthase/poly-beta-1,6-N-acetylglucosamine synthase-like glycosyltransferase
MSKLSEMHPPRLNMTTDSPLISVCMPVYNTEPYIVEAIESVLVQADCNFEFIIIDDGSRDSSSRKTIGLLIGTSHQALGIDRPLLESEVEPRLK